jgi:hypothetical protein
LHHEEHEGHEEEEQEVIHEMKITFLVMAQYQTSY